jgi:hypothetical protein
MVCMDVAEEWPVCGALVPQASCLHDAATLQRLCVLGGVQKSSFIRQVTTLHDWRALHALQLGGNCCTVLDLVLAAGPGSASCMLQVRRGARAVCIHVRNVACVQVGLCSRVCEPGPLGAAGCSGKCLYRCGDRFSPFLQCICCAGLLCGWPQ